MPDRSSKRPSDPNQLGKLIVDIATGALDDFVQHEGTARPQPPMKNPAAVALGRLGGVKGGKARAAKLSSAERHEIAVRAATARWKHDG